MRDRVRTAVTLPVVGMVALLLLAVPSGSSAQSTGQGDVDQLLGRALAQQQAGDLLGAVQTYRVVLQSDPDRADVRSNLGAAYIALGRYDDGMKEYREAIRIEPHNPTYHLNLGLALYKAGRHEEAVPEFAQVLAVDPSNRNALVLSGDCELQLDRDAEVIKLLSPHQAEFPDDLAFAYVLGMAMVRSGDTEHGQVLIDRIFKAGESAEGHLLMGMAYLNKRDYKAALPELSRAVELNPRLPTVHTLYGRALLGNADQESAAREYGLALELNPNDFEANLQMGSLLERQQRFDDALTYLGRAAAIRPSDLAVRHAQAGAYLGQGDAEHARVLLESVIKEQPEFIDAHVLLATAYYRLKRKDDGDRERGIVTRLTAESQARQPGAKAADAPATPAGASPQGTTGQQ